MSRWTEIVARIREQRVPAVLVSVDSIVGSTPREPGAKMIVTADELFGTIGGGNLEYQACRIARDQLQFNEDDGLRRFPLGAGLGQCCGGLVNLMFERLDENSDWESIAAEEAGFDSVMVSDHFQPWRHNDGHAPYAFSWMGAIALRSNLRSI